MTASQRVPVGLVHARFRRGCRYLIDVHAAVPAFVREPKDDVADCVLPQGRTGAHDCKADGLLVGLLAVVLLDERSAIWMLGGPRQRQFGEQVIFRTAIVSVPQSAVDVGHGVNAGSLQLCYAAGKPLLRGEVMRVIIVKRHLVPIVPMEPYRFPNELPECFHLWHALGRRAASHGPGVQFAQPLG